jgi:hypothetical protein
MDEVDHQARLLARLAAGHAADALLVDPLRRGRREMHADRRARRVPALGEQLRVDEHVDLAALVGREDARQLALGRLARDGLRLEPVRPHRLGDVVGVAHAGRIDHAGHPVEAGLVEVGDRDVEGVLIQQLGQHLLVELGVDFTAAQRHLGDRPHAGPGRDADAAQRRDHAAARRLGEVEARGLGGEEVGDVARDQGARRRHADEDWAGPAADRGARLLSQRRVGLVADDDRVGVGDLARVAHEPLVGLDRDRAVGAVLVAEQGRRDALGVATVAQLAVELVHQVAPVGEDEDAPCARRLDKAHGGHRLARAGRVLEPEAPGRVGVLGLLGELGVLVEVGLLFRPVDRLLVGVDLLVDLLLAGDGRRGQLRRRDGRGDGAVAVPVAVRPLHLGGERDQRARQGVDLVGGQLGSVGQVGLVLREQALEPQQQRELAPPLHRRVVGAGVELGQRRVERAPAGAPRRQGLLGGLPLEHEGLTGKVLCPLDVGGNWKRRGLSGRCDGFSHDGLRMCR